MAAVTPRRSARIPHAHTPKMSERKKGLFQAELEASRESLTKHRRLPVVDSESDSEDCDLGIISTLDSSSGEENEPSVPKTPERRFGNEMRCQTRNFLKENNDLKNFIKSPFTLKKYQTRNMCDKSGSVSTPVTPHLQYHPGTPSSSHSCASAHTTSSTSSRARKSLASLIADTESCSSSLKDLNFDTDSGTDSKENTPTKSLRRSKRHKLTPKFHSFKGILLEQKKNISPMKNAVVCLTKMDMSCIMSPTQMLKTPHNTTETASPPKIHNRRSVVEIAESPESCDSERSQKRLRNDTMNEGPSCKYPRLDVPKARLSLFNSDRLKEILSTKSFYGKTNPELNTNVATKISHAIEATTHQRRSFSHSQKRKRKPGQINLGVRHRIRKPKHKKNIKNVPINVQNKSNLSISMTDTSKLSQNSSQELVTEKADPFHTEKQTIEALLSQWTEEEIPESELSFKPQELPCFNSTIIEETSQIFEPVTAVPVKADLPQDQAVIVELGKKPQDVVMVDGGAKTEFLPVDGGYIIVDENATSAEELTDLDAIERELEMLDQQIFKIAQSNNINAEAVLKSTEVAYPVATESPKPVEASAATPKENKLFPIFDKPNPGISSSATKDKTSKRSLLKNGSDQYVIDAGQKKFGATQCNECGTIYQIGDPQDEHDHLVHHNASDVLRFNGWKDECVVGNFGSGRCIRVRGGEPGWKRVEAVLSRVVHPHLGYEGNLPKDKLHTYTAYLYIEKKHIIGCMIMEPKMKAYKFIPGDPDCCSVEDYPVKCGVSRIWTHINHRRKHVASRLLDCGRVSFLYGAALNASDVAFSAPTAAGKLFATKYCKCENFYVYLD